MELREIIGFLFVVGIISGLIFWGAYANRKAFLKEIQSQCALYDARPIGKISDREVYVCDKNGNTIRIELNGKNSRVYE